MTGTKLVEAGSVLRSTTFDTGLIGGVTALAVGSAAVVAWRPELFTLVLVLDLWFLGYHHVIATFTRFLTDANLVRDHRGLLTWVPLVVVAGAVAAGTGIGLWTLVTVYLYWQWFHYTRQSWGIARLYERRADHALPEPDRLFQLVFAAVPVAGILYRSHQSPERFLDLQLWTAPVPLVVVQLALLGAAGLVAASIWFRFQAWRRGQLPVAHTLYLATHVLVFAVGYLLIAEIDIGWLGVNIWHNAQYLLLVWHVNNRSASDRSLVGWFGAVARRPGAGLYLAVTMLMSTVAYLAMGLTVAAVVAPLIAFQAVNFHHYIVDGVIWKTRASAAAAPPPTPAG